MSPRAASSAAAEWPAAGIENLGCCPVCGDTGRTLLHEGLEDRIFRAAPGRWTLWRCAGCRSGYLDPRPTADTIHLAYSTYYTHQDSSGLGASTAGGGTREFARSAYASYRYGVRRSPAALLGPLVRRVRPRLAELTDYRRRYVEPPRGVGAPKVLDVGCGNGAFLRLARESGWQAFGCDFDPKAVSAAQGEGVEVRLGGPEAFHDLVGAFDALTLSHVVEHVHDPAGFIGKVKALLKPGGQLFLDTPNIEALGLEKFGADWRGLEPPRHLVLFNWDTMENLLREAGFGQIIRRPQVHVAEQIWKKSDRIRRGMDPYDTRSAYSADVLDGLPPPSAFPRDRTEFISLTARRAR